MSDIIVLHTAERLFSKWQNVSVQRSMRGLCGTFDFTASGARTETSLYVAPQQSCKISVAGKSIMTAWVEGTDRSGDSETKQSIVRGRDITCDLVDCCIQWPPPIFSGVTIGSLAQTLCKPYGIKVIDKSGSTDLFQNFQVNRGEKVFECIARAAAYKSQWVITNEFGELVITPGGTEFATDSLVLGKNVLNYVALNDFSSRYSLIQVMPSADPDVALMLTQNQMDSINVKDSEVKRFRPLITVGEDTVFGFDFLKQRAEFEQKIRKAQSQTIEITVRGFTQSNGSLWKPDLRVFVDIPDAFVKGKMVVADCHWNYSEDSGPRTTMKLVRNESLSIAIPATTNPFFDFSPETSGIGGGSPDARIQAVL